MGLVDALARDVTYVARSLKTLSLIKSVAPDSDVTVADHVERWVDRYGDRTALIFQGDTLTYREMDAAANRFANWATAQGLKKGDVVALVLDNRLDYVTAWIGLLKLGVTVALVNYHLRAHALAHCVNISGARMLVTHSDLAESNASAVDFYTDKPAVWMLGGAVQGANDLDAALASASDSRPERSLRAGLTQNDVAFLIYTSGTTGLPKAAKFKHFRALTAYYGFAGMVAPKRDDRMYIALPLYHATGGQCAVGLTLSHGGAVIIAPKFSASRFWHDIAKHGATMFTYVGELCRYLINSPTNADERRHAVRRVFGNGMRPDVWPAFVKRFGISDIVEFYSSTEGNISMFNVDGREGAMGRLPWYLKRKFDARLVRFDYENEVPVRGADGFLQECGPDEPGELIGRIKADVASARFEGYHDAEATAKKILRDAFEKGDAWFRSGDLVKRDAEDYYYFVDRIGDTFRWKGENVSTLEVAHVLNTVPGVAQATVYGVQIPGYDGRAGMAAISCDHALDFSALVAQVTEELPSYARPIFLRLRRELEATGTFKEKKTDLVKEGFDPETVTDPLYYLDPAAMRYEPLGADGFQRITSGDLRL